MKRFECVYKGDIYTCEVANSVYGGASITICKVRQGREPKSVLHKHCKSDFEAMMEMEKYLPDANWEDRT